MSGYTVYSSTSVTDTPNTAGYKKDSIDPYILHLCLNSDKTKVLTASCRNQLQVYDQNTLEFQQLLSGHTDTINVLECSKLNPFIYIRVQVITQLMYGTCDKIIIMLVITMAL